jgi:hypothetical protein
MIISSIVVLAEAVADLNDGKRFYDHINEGVGNYYWDSVVSDIESLIIYAGIHPQFFGLYRLLAKRFPYAIYYELDGSVVRVVAVLPMRRKPLWINQQLGKR